MGKRERFFIGAWIFLCLLVLFSIPIPIPKPTCKVCHCGQTTCHRECSEENMCAMRCEGLCKRGK